MFVDNKEAYTYIHTYIHTVDIPVNYQKYDRNKVTAKVITQRTIPTTIVPRIYRSVTRNPRVSFGTLM